MGHGHHFPTNLRKKSRTGWANPCSLGRSPFNLYLGIYRAPEQHLTGSSLSLAASMLPPGNCSFTFPEVVCCARCFNSWLRIVGRKRRPVFPSASACVLPYQRKSHAGAKVSRCCLTTLVLYPRWQRNSISQLGNICCMKDICYINCDAIFKSCVCYVLRRKFNSHCNPAPRARARTHIQSRTHARTHANRGDSKPLTNPIW